MMDGLFAAANFRDLGGVLTASGMQVKRKRIYRSASLASLTEEEQSSIYALGIHTIVDLRTNRERVNYPTPWEALGSTIYWSRDHENSNADLTRRLHDPDFTADTSLALMTDFYRELPYAQTNSYARLFRALLDGQMPVLFHCAAGKDRTGGAAALILVALGVPSEAIVHDYCLTNSFNLQVSRLVKDQAPVSDDRAIAIAPLMAANPVYLEGMFAGIEARSKSVERYLQDELGLTVAELAQLREDLLEQPS